MQVSVCLKYM